MAVAAVVGAVAADVAVIGAEIAATAVTAGKQAFRNWVRSAPADPGRVTPLKKFKAVVLRPTGFAEPLTFAPPGRPIRMWNDNDGMDAPPE